MFGSKCASTKGMLRITIPTPDQKPAVYVLEGRLTGLWVKELLRVTRGIGPNSDCVFDLEAVSYVDRLGEETLRWLNRIGVRFATDTAHGKELCHRLHLRRVSTAIEASKPGQVTTEKELTSSLPPSTPSQLRRS
jgi:hypothetical protein